MNKTATRKIDNLGRLIIPKEIMEKNNYKKGDILEIFLYKNYIYASKVQIEKVIDEQKKFTHNRKIDNMSRVCIPMEIRKYLNIQTKDDLNIISNGKYLKILKI